MGLKRSPLTRAQSQTRYDKGHGQGEGSSYKPWIEVKSIASLGVSRRVCGRTNGRQHALLSNHEWKAFLACQHLRDVIDIREQFPLWDLDETERIAASLGVRHPGPLSADPQVMTTDLLLTLRSGDLMAISVKSSKDLEDKRTLEKLEIERRYWVRRNVKWSIVTERDIPPAVSFNLELLDGSYNVTPATIKPEAIPQIEALLLQRLRDKSEMALKLVCARLDMDLGYKQGMSMTVLKHALAHRRLEIPMGVKVDVAQPLRGVTLALISPKGIERDGDPNTSKKDTAASDHVRPLPAASNIATTRHTKPTPFKPPPSKEAALKTKMKNKNRKTLENKPMHGKKI